VTIASRPSWWDETARVLRASWVKREEIYLCKSGWTGFFSAAPVGQITLMLQHILA
jgi:hypothetical protein